MQITYEQSAYLDMKWHRLEDVRGGRANSVMLTQPDGGEYFEGEGYVRIGSATVVLTLNEDKEIADSQLQSLNKQLSAVRAENQQRENAILDRISKLQSLSYEAA